MHSKSFAEQKEHGVSLEHLIFRCRHCVHAADSRLEGILFNLCCDNFTSAIRCLPSVHRILIVRAPHAHSLVITVGRTNVGG